LTAVYNGYFEWGASAKAEQLLNNRLSYIDADLSNKGRQFVALSSRRLVQGSSHDSVDLELLRVVFSCPKGNFREGRQSLLKNITKK
jgi:hypothetical protein